MPELSDDVCPLKKVGKHPGKQVQVDIATWGSRPTRCNGELSGDLAPRLGTAGIGTFDALSIPKVAARALKSASGCFPGFAEHGGGAKNGPEGPLSTS